MSVCLHVCCESNHIFYDILPGIRIHLIIPGRTTFFFFVARFLYSDFDKHPLAELIRQTGGSSVIYRQVLCPIMLLLSLVPRVAADGMHAWPPLQIIQHILVQALLLRRDYDSLAGCTKKTAANLLCALAGRYLR